MCYWEGLQMYTELLRICLFFLKSDCSLQQALNHCACKSAETYALPFCGTVWFLLHVAGPAQGIVTDVQAVVWR